MFTVDNPLDEEWLGRRINFEKDKKTGSSKFWLGLTSKSPSGPLVWLNGKRKLGQHPLLGATF